MKDIRDTHIGYYDPETCDPEEFKALIAQDTQAEDAPFASEIQKNIPLYDMSALRPDLEDPVRRRAIHASLV